MGVPDIAFASHASLPAYDYRNPPVHEVILNLVFASPVERARIESIPQRLSEFGTLRSARAEVAGVTFSIGPSGQQQFVGPTAQTDGWWFRDDPQTRVLLTNSTQVDFHHVRSGRWPSGQYMGWSSISRDFFDLLDHLEPIYGDTPVRRVGLRYLNRIAVPDNTDLSRWFLIGLRAPSLLLDPYSFAFRETWARIAGEDDLSATIAFARIAIEDEALSVGNVGFLLDIDVFNLWVPNAPTYSALRDWFERAHSSERRIFEGCISEELRQRWGVIDL
jgi:uncharacterized protein (TIGR04255 family)